MSTTPLVGIRDKNDLITYIAEGNRVEYLFFWGHKKNNDATVGATCLSQWFEAGFDIDGIRYPTAEHYMMAEKARLFGDDDALQKILQATHPGDAKKLGRTVKNYQEEMWRQYRFDIVVRGNRAKFSQNDRLKKFFISTEKKVLVEASPRDRIWGIGMGKSNPDVESPSKWKGLNLLGFALMEVRAKN